MSSNKKHDKYRDINASGDDEGTGSSGGQSGQIEFHDFLATGANLRDDLLPFEEQKRLLSTHKDLHEAKVKQQKEKRDQYKDLKNGKVPLKAFREGLMASGLNAQYKANPILANKAQFSGIDRQVNALPTENLAETNQDKRDELLNELKYRLGYQPAPAFNPKPHGPGY
ncbi:hypothetical protein AQUSIP_26100 [Aquicella siphonis]|uniref:Uncharacterized protein n=1 Tax=Aquicella siphonis TaxID=254247 RepID=A0A5E4PLV8_9COXI|nr:hypothetical protein [Aquicella siphonis]VVC77283.1 hypothetical protein AQUSIP_26100 [Aquicella siphonis]